MAFCVAGYCREISGARSEGKQLTQLPPELKNAGCRRAANAAFRSLHEAWADTTTTTTRAVDPIERHVIVARTSDGRKATRAHGVLFGRPRKLRGIGAAKPSSPPRCR